MSNCQCAHAKCRSCIFVLYCSPSFHRMHNPHRPRCNTGRTSGICTTGLESDMYQPLQEHCLHISNKLALNTNRPRWLCQSTEGIKAIEKLHDDLQANPAQNKPEKRLTFSLPSAWPSSSKCTGLSTECRAFYLHGSTSGLARPWDFDLYCTASRHSVFTYTDLQQNMRGITKLGTVESPLFARQERHLPSLGCCFPAVRSPWISKAATLIIINTHATVYCVRTQVCGNVLGKSARYSSCKNALVITLLN